MNFSTPRHLFALLLCASVALALPACDSGGDEEPGIEGQWSGTANVQGGAISVDVTLNESDGDISGNGVLNVGGETASTDVSGTYNYPNVSLTFSTQQYEDLSISGDINEGGTQIDGELNGSGFSGQVITLTRD